MIKREEGDLQKSRSPLEKRPIATHLNLEARAEPREYACDRSKHISCRKRNESATSGPRGLTTNYREKKRKEVAERGLAYRNAESNKRVSDRFVLANAAGRNMMVSL